MAYLAVIPGILAQGAQAGTARRGVRHHSLARPRLRA